VRLLAQPISARSGRARLESVHEDGVAGDEDLAGEISRLDQQRPSVHGHRAELGRRRETGVIGPSVLHVSSDAVTTEAALPLQIDLLEVAGGLVETEPKHTIVKPVDRVEGLHQRAAL